MNKTHILLASLTLIPLILSIGIIPNISFVDALQDRDAETECIEGKILVFRTIANNYACVSESTAKKWVGYGIAEIVGETVEEETMEEETMEEETMEEETMEEGTASFGNYDFGTVTSSQDPGIGHESHQLAIILPLSQNIYVGKLTYSASEPVQYVTLTGPIADEDIGGQPTWTPDGETHYALTLIDQELSSGGWFFAGNALALHTMNPTPFHSSYSVVYADVPPGVYSKGTVSTGTVHSIQDPGIGHENHSIALILPPRDIPYQGGVIS